MSRKTTATAPKTKNKKIGKRTIAIFDEIRRHFGKNPVKYGDNPPKPELKLIPIKDFDLEDLYQRAKKMIKIREIATEFDYRYLGIPLIAYRNGKAYLLDAQQRVTAIQLINVIYEDFLTSLWCEVVPETRGKTEEAKVFIGRNNSKKLLPTETFKAEWAAKEAEAVGIVKTLHANGLTIKGIPRHEAVPISCISAVKYAHKAGVLTEAIEAIHSTWGLIDEAFQVTCFHPIAAILQKNRGKVDKDRLVDTLKKFKPAGLKALANTTDGHNRTVNIARRIVAAYNKGRRASQKLDEVRGGDV